MIAWSVEAEPGGVVAGAEDSYIGAVAAVLDATRGVLLARGRDAVYPGRYTLCVDGDRVAVLGVGRAADGHPDRAGALDYLDRIEDVLSTGTVAASVDDPL